MSVAAPCFEQQHRGAAVLAQAVSEYTSGGSCPNNDVVIRIHYVVSVLGSQSLACLCCSFLGRIVLVTERHEHAAVSGFNADWKTIRGVSLEGV